MTQKLICKMSEASYVYDIVIGYGLLYQQSHYMKQLASKFAIITDDLVGALYGEKLKNYLNSVGLNTHLFTFPHGEQNKSRITKEAIENQLFEKKFNRDTCIIALGGGVVTDLAGFIAATYCRGVPLINIPTTLLGMVDASIGGKTGINVPYGKNMLGCIYQPKKVIIDLETLKSLQKKEFTQGIVEAIKHGLIADAQLFNNLEIYADRLNDAAPSQLEKIIYGSCRIKTEIVERDEKDNGVRNLLNFGHTVGHALEMLSNYSVSHGEAVAIGLIVESYISNKLGILDQNSFNRIKSILLKYELTFKLPLKYSSEEIIKAMSMDKKSLNEHPRFVTINAIGSHHHYGSQYCTPIEKTLLHDALEWMTHDLCCY